jgi:hypothetical protein
MQGISKCEKCGIEFKWSRSRNQKSKPRFCSRECRHSFAHIGFRPGGKYRIDEMTTEEKFERLKKSYEKNVIRKFGCWGWEGTQDKGGYGIMSSDRRHGPDRAHRASWVIHKGEIPKGLLVCHKCDRPECTNPDHLFLGTPSENTKDMIHKNRKCIGSNVPTAKLNEENVKLIKVLLKQKISYPKIAEMFNVGINCIVRIKRGETWKHIELGNVQSDWKIRSENR